MAKSNLLQPQFIHTLVPSPPGFHSHLTIPIDFFSKYVEEEKIMETNTAELRSDSSDIIWNVKMIGRRFTDGWEEFAVANNFRIGDVVLVRYEGDLLFHVSPLGSKFCEIVDMQPPSNNIDGDRHDDDDQFELGKSLLKKHSHPRTNDCDDDDDDEDLPMKKKVKKSSDEIGIDSSSLGNSCFVAIVTTSNLLEDTLYLPQHFTSSNGLTRKCRKIFLIDGSQRSWTLDMSVKESTDAFYISQGWRNFCEENGQKAGGVFMFKLVGNGETPVLSFCLTESVDNISDCSEACGRESLSSEQGESNEDVEMERTKNSTKRRASPYSSYSPSHKQFVTFTLPRDYVRIARLSLPVPFLRENGINKPGEIYLVGKDGKKCITNLLLDGKGTMSLGKGWKEFVKVNGLESGFTLKLMWEDTTPVLSLCCAESTSDREQEEYLKAIGKQSLFIDPSNGEMISNDERKSWETPVLGFCPTESSDNRSQRDCSEANERESLSTELSDKEGESNEDNCRIFESLMETGQTKSSPKRRALPYSSYSPSHKQFVTFTLPPDYAKICRLSLPVPFLRENGINKPGEIYLLAKDGTKWLTSLLLDTKGTISLGKGWKEFVKANGLESGFTVKLTWEDTTPVLSLCCAESTSDREQEEYLKAIEKQSLFMDPGNREKISKEERTPWEREKNHLRTDFGEDEELPRKKKVKKNSHETEADSSSLGNSCFVATVTALNLLTDILYLPQNFTSSNGFAKQCRKIVLVDGGVRSWVLDLTFDESSDAFYISQGWKNFCDDNRQKAGGLFMFKLVGHGETPVLSFYPTESMDSRSQRDVFEASGRESLSTELGKEEEDMEGESNEDKCRVLEEPLMENEKTYSPKRRSYSSYSPSHKLFVTFTLPPDYARIGSLSLPVPFVKGNGINKPGKIYLQGKDGTKWLTNLLLDKKGTMSLGKGWKEFVKANGLESGFTLKLIWEETTPVLSLCCAKSTIAREQGEAVEKQFPIDPRNGGHISEYEKNEDERSREREKNHLRWRDSTPSSQKEFVTLTITPYSVKNSTLRLPRKFTRENNINKPGVIILLGKDSIRQPTSLYSDKENRTMFLGSGWKPFVKANGLSTGDSFTLKLIWEDTTPVLSFCCEKFTADREQGEYLKAIEKQSLCIDPSNGKKISEDENTKEERKSWGTPVLSACPTESIDTRSQRHCSEASGREYLSTELSNKEGESNGDDCRISESFCCSESTRDREQEECLKATEQPSLFIDPSNKEETMSPWESEKNPLRWRDSTPSSENQFVTLTITPYSVDKCVLRLPKKFTRENGINDLGMITLLGKDGIKQQTKLLYDKRNGVMSLGSRWKDFAEANGLNMGDSFTLKLIWEDTTPVLSLCCEQSREQSRSDREQEEFPEAIERQFLSTDSSSGDKISKDESNKEERMSWEKDMSPMRSRDSTPSSQNQSVTLILTPHSVEKCILRLPREFTMENGIDKPGMITLLGKDGIKQPTRLLVNKGTVCLGSGWKNFVKANGLKAGDSITFKLIWEDTTPILSLCTAGFGIDIREGEVCTEASKKEPLPNESSSREKNSEGESNKEGNNIEEESRLWGRDNNHMDSTSPSQIGFVTLTLTHEDVKACKLHLPRRYMAANGINKLGKMTILGGNGVEWSAFLLSRDGLVALGIGWDEFCEANGVKLGMCFSLKFISEQEDNTTPMFKLCSLEM